MTPRVEGTSRIRVLLDSISTGSFVKQFLFPFLEQLLLDVLSDEKLFGLDARALCDGVRDQLSLPPVHFHNFVHVDLLLMLKTLLAANVLTVAKFLIRLLRLIMVPIEIFKLFNRD